MTKTSTTSASPHQRGLVWFRRDLRNVDHAALYHALKQTQQCYCCFIFDHTILSSLPADDKRVQFIYQSIIELRQALREMGGELIVRHGDPVEVIPVLVQELKIDAVFTNRDYEPQAKLRDAAVKTNIAKLNCDFFSYKDQVIFEEDEVLSLANKPFSVFTPYKNAWLKKLASEVEGGPDFYFKAYPVERYAAKLAKHRDQDLPSLERMGFQAPSASLKIKGGMQAASDLIEDFSNRIDHYADTRDFPAIKGPSYLSVHLRFGTISIRYLVNLAVRQMRIANQQLGASVWLSELVWRDFYFMILHHHQHVVNQAFKPEYDAIQWEQGSEAQALFEAWCEARTGYPLVDAAMLQLNQSGYMHNRLRMVVASFLIKDLGIDWRWGERYFALKLNDFDLAANNGGWQWAASSGCDAQPYFRIFNPITQSEKFDSEGKFIRKYLPQLAHLSSKHIHAPWTAPPLELAAAGVTLGENYPRPIIQHDIARQRTLERYNVVKKVTK